MPESNIMIGVCKQIASVMIIMRTARRIIRLRTTRFRREYNTNEKPMMFPTQPILKIMLDNIQLPSLKSLSMRPMTWRVIPQVHISIHQK